MALKKVFIIREASIVPGMEFQFTSNKNLPPERNTAAGSGVDWNAPGGGPELKLVAKKEQWMEIEDCLYAAGKNDLGDIIAEQLTEQGLASEMDPENDLT